VLGVHRLARRVLQHKRQAAGAESEHTCAPTGERSGAYLAEDGREGEHRLHQPDHRGLVVGLDVAREERQHLVRLLPFHLVQRYYQRHGWVPDCVTQADT